MKLTNLNKIYWPSEGYTKGDLIAYYEKISPIILPYLKDRPQSLHRYPDGIAKEGFYQKDVDHKVPDWIQTLPIESVEDYKIRNYLLCQDKETLVFMANWGCVEINPWNSKKENLDRPDFIVLDLDPEDIDFSYVREAAIAAKKVMDEFSIFGLPKTSGATGIHIYIPLGGEYHYQDARNFAKILALLIHKKLPQITSIERSPKKRQKKVYIDYLQNSYGQTVVAPYSLRPLPKAPVSTPLDWDELNYQFQPTQYNIKTIFDRTEKKGDLFQSILNRTNNIETIIKKMDNYNGNQL